MLNKPHEAQPTSVADFQVGVRAQDGTIYPITISTNATADEKTATTSTPMRLHDLFIGLARFHILVFISSPTTPTLRHTVTQFVNQWRTRYTFTSALQDGYADKNLFKFHFLITSTSIPTDDEAIQEQSKKPIGEGKIFLDEGGKIHKKYGVELGRGSEGGIVVLRPDSHIGYRVNGLQEQAWKDVDQYFSSFLASQHE